MSAMEWMPELSQRAARRSRLHAEAQANPRPRDAGERREAGAPAATGEQGRFEASAAGSREWPHGVHAVSERDDRQCPAAVMVLAPVAGLLIWGGLIALAL